MKTKMVVQNRQKLVGIVLGVILIGARCAKGAPEISPTQRPQFPSVYDRLTVTKELAEIDQSPNATFLKVGYFMRGGSPSLPLSEGFGMLRDALAHETAGSDRWFVLEQIGGFAAFRGKDLTSDFGYQYYEDLFAHTSDAKSEVAKYALATGIADYVFSVHGKLRDLGIDSTPRTREVLSKAWQSYVMSEPSNSYLSGFEIEWNKAIDASGSSDQFKILIEQKLKENVAPNVGVLRAAIGAYAVSSPGLAVSIMQRNETVGTATPTDAVWFYETLCELQLRAGRPKEALSTAKTLVDKSGKGYDRLLKAAFLTHDRISIDAALTALSKPSADEGQILLAADVSVRSAALAGGDQSETWGAVERLLANYLSSERDRQLVPSLHGRFLLGTVLNNLGKIDDAIRTLRLPDVNPNELDPTPAFYINSIKRLRLTLIKAKSAAANTEIKAKKETN